MEYIKGFTFRLEYHPEQSFSDKKTKEALLTLKKETAIDTVVIAIGALQDTPHSERIDYCGDFIPDDQILTDLILFARKEGLRVILKPMVNCRDGVWRAFINFFDLEVPCEPKWSRWFASYTDYILHYAKIAEATGCEMLIIGCELVMTERKEIFWRQLISEVRQVYHGLLTYNTDKYQETEIKWWDAVDVISSSGYYPSGKWEENLERIKTVTDKYQKPFFFAECGIPCRKGSAAAPNDWTYEGELDLEEQAGYYREMFAACQAYPFVQGFVCWDWTSDYLQYPVINDGYSVYGKPACEVIQSYYQEKSRNPADEL